MYDSTGPVSFLEISEASAASNVVLAALTGRIRILGLCLVAAGAVTATLEDEDGVNISGPMSLITGTPLVLPTNGIGYGQTAVAKGLNLLLGGAVQVSGVLVYQEVESPPA